MTDGPPEDDRERWNRKHSSVQVGGWTPRPWLTEHRALLDEQPARRALDVACGRGREALYLAEIGFEVDALDVSDVVVDALADTARARGLPVRAQQVDLAAAPDPLEHGAYDVVTCFYFLQRALLPALAAALAPGGLLFYETFTRDHVDVLGREMNREVLLGHNELLHAFTGLRVLRYREEVIGDERRRAVASVVARA
ncbi:MAG: methyltransferase domain-containing protein [Solirubrobacterales bacterium]|nr:methyltransferase domain-containing protein [Solirubrobacterales bacterium]